MATTNHKKIKLREVNRHLVCRLCRGYYVDATTIAECLHSFCRSCIIKYLEKNSFCPICEVQIHKTKPYLSLRLDKALQDVVYKVVPGLYHDEMRRRREFYSEQNERLPLATPEQCGLEERIIFSPEDSISLSLEYLDSDYLENETVSSQSSDSGDTQDGFTLSQHLSLKLKANDKSSRRESQDTQEPSFYPKRYLQCPAVVNIGHLKKFVRMKHDLIAKAEVDIIHKRVPLPDHYTLMDVAYIYTWKRSAPLRLFYQIYKTKKQKVVLPTCIPEAKAVESQPLKDLNKVKSEVNGKLENNSSVNHVPKVNKNINGTVPNPVGKLPSEVPKTSNDSVALKNSNMNNSVPENKTKETSKSVGNVVNNETKKEEPSCGKDKVLSPIKNKTSDKTKLSDKVTPEVKSKPDQPSTNESKVQEMSANEVNRNHQQNQPNNNERLLLNPVSGQLESVPFDENSNPAAVRVDEKKDKVNGLRKEKENKKESNSVKKIKLNKNEPENGRREKMSKKDFLMIRKERGNKKETDVTKKEKINKKESVNARKDRSSKKESENLRKEKEQKKEIENARKDREQKKESENLRKEKEQKKEPENVRKDKEQKKESENIRKETGSEKESESSEKENEQKKVSECVKNEKEQEIIKKDNERREESENVRRQIESANKEADNTKKEKEQTDPEKEKESKKEEEGEKKSSLNILKSFRKEKQLTKETKIELKTSNGSTLTITALPRAEKPGETESCKVSPKEADKDDTVYEFDGSSSPGKNDVFNKQTKNTKSKYLTEHRDKWLAKEAGNEWMTFQEYREMLLKQNNATENLCTRAKRKSVPNLFKISPEDNKRNGNKEYFGKAEDTPKEKKSPPSVNNKHANGEDKKSIPSKNNSNSPPRPIKIENKGGEYFIKQEKTEVNGKSSEGEKTKKDDKYAIYKNLLENLQVKMDEVSKKLKADESRNKNFGAIDLTKGETNTKEKKNDSENVADKLNKSPSKDEEKNSSKTNLEPLLKVPQYSQNVKNSTAKDWPPPGKNLSSNELSQAFLQLKHLDVINQFNPNAVLEQFAKKTGNLDLLYQQKIDFIRRLKRHQQVVEESVPEKRQKFSPPGDKKHLGGQEGKEKGRPGTDEVAALKNAEELKTLSRIQELLEIQRAVTQNFKMPPALLQFYNRSRPYPAPVPSSLSNSQPPCHSGKSQNLVSPSGSLPLSMPPNPSSFMDSPNYGHLLSAAGLHTEMSFHQTFKNYLRRQEENPQLPNLPVLKKSPRVKEEPGKNHTEKQHNNSKPNAVKQEPKELVGSPET